MTDGNDSTYDDFSQWVRGLRADMIFSVGVNPHDHEQQHENRRRPRNDHGPVGENSRSLHRDSDCKTIESMCESTTAFSHLTGGFTTITNILDGSPDAVVDQRCSPSRSIFQVVGVLDTSTTSAEKNDSNYDHDSHFGTFASYYNMQKNGPRSPDAHVGCENTRILKQYEVDDDGADQSIDTEEGGRRFCEQRHSVDYNRIVEDDQNSKGGRSSLSSITNEFFYPKLNGKDSYINYSSRKKNSATKNDSRSQTANKRKSPSSNTMDTNARVAAPWYSISRMQLQPRFLHEDVPEQREQHLQEQDAHTVLSNAHLVGQQAVVVDSRPPCEVIISPLGHVNSLGMVPHPLSQSPSVISSSDFSHYFTNDLRERYKSIIHRSYRTHYHQFINSSCAKKCIVALVSISLIVAMITATTVVLGRHVPRAWTDSVNITLVIPGRDGFPYACCVDGNTGLYVPQDESSINLQSEQENSSEESASPSSNNQSSASGIGSIFDESGKLAFSSSKGDVVEPTNDPASTLYIPATPPSKQAIQATHSSPTGLPTKASKFFNSQEATPTIPAFGSISSPSNHPILVSGPMSLNPSIVIIDSVDTTVDELRPNVNYGNEPYLSIKGSIKVALVKFDLSVVNGRSIHKASLVLHSLINEQGDGSASQVTVGVLPQAGDWDEGSLTWRNIASSRAGSFVVNQFQSENSQTRRHEVDVLRAVENSLRPSVQGVSPSGTLTFELYTESGKIVQFASKEWNGGILQPELMVYLSDNTPSTTPTRMPLTDKPRSSPVTSIPSIEISLVPSFLKSVEPSAITQYPTVPISQVPSLAMPLSPSFSESAEPSATTQYPTVPISQVPSIAISESPTGSPLTPTASPFYPTSSPHNPTAAPFYPTSSPLNPTIHPTLTKETSAPVTAPVALKVFDPCPYEQSSDAKHVKNDVVSYKVDSTWQVYQCVEDQCTGAPKPGQTDSSWVLVGTCRDGPPEPYVSNSPSSPEVIKATIFPTPAPNEAVRHY